MRAGFWASGLLLVAAGCQQLPREPSWAAAVARADPLLGSGEALLTRLRASPRHELDPESQGWAACAAEITARHDARARAHVETYLDAVSSAAVLEFLSGAAGQALLAAESTAVLGYPQQPGTFPEDAVARFTDPDFVGDAALRQLETARAAVADGGSASPQLLSLALGAARLTPDQARAIAAFHASPAGERWHAARRSAWPDTQRRFHALAAAAVAAGVAAGVADDRLDDLPDLVLPDQR